MVDHDDVHRRHGYHPLRVRDVVPETSDTRSYVLDVPDDVADLFAYRAGQFCTFRVTIDGEQLLRCYSMSSAPETDPALTVTVKRVPGGAVSNWLLDNVTEGDVLEATRPAGVFTVPDGDAPVVAFCGGSGVTPIMSIAKSTLAATDRGVRILSANRNADSVIFRDALARLEQAHPDRLEIRHHLDSDGGYLTPEDVRAFARGWGDDALYFVCGPTPFMDLVERTLLADGVAPTRIFLERFGDVPVPPDIDRDDVDPTSVAAEGTETVTIILNGERTEVRYRPGDTLLQTARSGGLQPPFSCEAGNCATCMALVHDGAAPMRTNNALTPDEVDEGWVLTCQAVPESHRVTVEYEAF